MNLLVTAELIKKGKEYWDKPASKISLVEGSTYTADPVAANKLVCDLRNHPHAFVLGCIADQQVKADIAWTLPLLISNNLNNNFSFGRLAQLSSDEFSRIMSGSKHRFWKKMALYFYGAVRRIEEQYEGNAAKIWNDEPSSAELVFRFLQFEGVGPKIATMAANILARDFKVKLADRYSIDISADRHVKRVFKNLQFVSEDADVDEVIYKARAINPEYPGLLDLPCFEIGRRWCKRDGSANCEDCYLTGMCPTSERFFRNKLSGD